MKIEEAPELTPEEQLKTLLLMEPGSKRYVTDTGCMIWVSPPTDETAWHMSISHPHRYPKWNEIKQAREELLPKNKTFAMLLPPEEEYVNIHSNCFHLWQVVGRYRSVDLIHKEAFK